ncbi:MAG: helix-turn-helix transcriptional regulator [Oscillospiraceae bacterium]|nr:helix-turn-helix transcriptional regulator [Oscillospiraceae bacterium]
MYRNRLRDLREDRDLKQAALADYLQIHQTTYSDYELGKLNVPINVLHALADYYDTSIDYLLGRTPEKKPYPKR